MSCTYRYIALYIGYMTFWRKHRCPKTFPHYKTDSRKKKCGFGDIHSPRTDGHDPLNLGRVLHDCTLMQTVNVDMFIVLLQVVIHAFLSALLSVARRQMIIRVDVRPSETYHPNHSHQVAPHHFPRTDYPPHYRDYGQNFPA